MTKASSSDRATRLINEGMTIFSLETRERVSSIIQGFGKLLEEPEAVRQTWMVDRSGGNDPDDGLIYRCGNTRNIEGEAYDEKFFFHFKAGLLRLLRAAGAREIRKHRNFLDECEELHGMLTVEILNLAHEVDTVMPGLGLCSKMVSREAMGMHCLRLLWYLRARPEGEHNIIGKYHCDRCTLSLHVADRYQGLCIGPELAPYEAKPNQALAFWGRKAPNINSRFRMVGHEIRDFAPEEKRPPRWSVVFFSHTDTPLADTIRYSVGREMWRPGADAVTAASA